MRIMDVRINENLMHAKDKPKVVFLPRWFTVRVMQHFQTSTDSITQPCHCGIPYPERGGEVAQVTESAASNQLNDFCVLGFFSDSGKVTEENKICNFLVQ